MGLLRLQRPWHIASARAGRQPGRDDPWAEPSHRHFNVESPTQRAAGGFYAGLVSIPSSGSRKNDRGCRPRQRKYTRLKPEEVSGNARETILSRKTYFMCRERREQYGHKRVRSGCDGLDRECGDSRDPRIQRISTSGSHRPPSGRERHRRGAES